jgi:hypothetical protein
VLALLPNGQISQNRLQQTSFAEKIGGRKITKFGKKWQKRGR